MPQMRGHGDAVSADGEIGRAQTERVVRQQQSSFSLIVNKDDVLAKDVALQVAPPAPVCSGHQPAIVGLGCVQMAKLLDKRGAIGDVAAMQHMAA